VTVPDHDIDVSPFYTYNIAPDRVFVKR